MPRQQAIEFELPSRLAARSDGGDAVAATQYEAFMLHGERFCVGDAAFVMPDAFGMPYEMPKQVKYSVVFCC